MTDPKIPSSYFPILGKIESSNQPYVKAASSSASGQYQFVKGVWQSLGGSWGDDNTKAFGGLRPSIDEQTDRARNFTMQNAQALQRAGIPVNNATLYAAHFLGIGTAVRVLQAKGSARADLIAGTAATNANPTVLRGKTVDQFRTWLANKTAA